MSLNTLKFSNLDRSVFEPLVEYMEDDFSIFAASILIHQLPSCYFEGWKELNRLSNKLKLPKKTDIIYVGSGIITDECLRLYVSRQVGLGGKFIISQHGGVYGHSLIQEKTEFVEHRVTDKWISWGLSGKKYNNVVTGYNLKNHSVKEYKSIDGPKLLIALPPIRISPSRLNYSDPMEIIKIQTDAVFNGDK